MPPRPEYAMRTGTAILRRIFRPKVERQNMDIRKITRIRLNKKLHLPRMYRNTCSGHTLVIYNTRWSEKMHLIIKRLKVAPL
eukprot:9664517-Heterocapsa_arctica.AAC.1